MKDLFKNSGVAVFGIVAFAVTILGSAYLISSTNFYIRDSSSAVSKDGEVVNTISVSGDGKVYATPDMVIIRVTVSDIEGTSEEALASVSTRISEIKEITEGNDIKEKDLQTTDFSINSEYEWINSRERFIGLLDRMQKIMYLLKIDLLIFCTLFIMED